MYLTAEIERQEEYPEKPAATGFSFQERGDMESLMHCAYNQTRECFLGLEVTAVNLPEAGVAELMRTLMMKSGEGLWMNPFHGIPASVIAAPLDLIYLDENCRVVEAVESFPTFRVSPANSRPVSVLALPAHSIYSSQTQAGDQLVLCVAEEMQQRLERLAGERAAAGGVQSAVLLREKPLWGGGPGMLELENRSGDGRDGAQQRHEMGLLQPGTETPPPPRSWLRRWWSPDPRRAPRVAAQGLAAYYWNGAAPEAHGIRDISSSGLYLVTEERWYPGTLVLMILQSTESGEQTTERAISVQSRAVRWGHDGVGLQFVLSDGTPLGRGPNSLLKGVDRKDLDRFLQRLKNCK